MNISHEQLASQLNELDIAKDKPVVVYCDRGGRARKAATALSYLRRQHLFFTAGGCTGPGVVQATKNCPAAEDRAEPCPAVRPPPRYPASALTNGGEAMVLLEFDVLENGHTNGVEV